MVITPRNGHNSYFENDKLIERISSILTDQVGKNKDITRMLIRQSDVIRNGYKYDTRPIYKDGDFQDFGHFDYIQYSDEKKRIQNDFITLYYLLNFTKNIDYDDANCILHVIKKYSSNFKMTKNKGKETRPFTDVLYNIITPFIDDIDEAITRTSDGFVLDTLDVARTCIKNLIYCRQML